MYGLSPAMAHRQQLAAAQAVKSADAPQPVSSVDKQMRYKLGSDRARLKKIASMQRKAEVKAEIVPEYLPYLHGQMQAGAGDEILTQVMVWALDANALVTFSALARYALDNGVAMPTDFARPLGAWLTESVAKTVLRLVEVAISADALGYENLNAIHQLTLWLERETAQMDMHDEIRAKLHRACGEILRDESPVLALEHFETALRFDHHIRVKTRIKALKEQLPAFNTTRALTESQHPQGQAADNRDNNAATPPPMVGSSTVAPLAFDATDGAS